MDNHDKFTHKAEGYAKHRPAYAPAFLDYLLVEAGVKPEDVIADIGAGTGILTRQLAPRVRRICAVEPNASMRAAFEAYCGDLTNVSLLDGSAEATTLEDGSVDHITAAQAFHWFDKERAKIEFRRVIKPGGQVILVWNSRAADSPFVAAYDALCRDLCPAFLGFSGGSQTDPMTYEDFFTGRCDHMVFPNDLHMTLDGYIGGALSASYAPNEGDSNYSQFVAGLTALFDEYNAGGILTAPNITRSYVGRVQ